MNYESCGGQTKQKKKKGRLLILRDLPGTLGEYNFVVGVILQRDHWGHGVQREKRKQRKGKKEKKTGRSIDV